MKKFLRELGLTAALFGSAAGTIGCEKPQPPSPDDGAIEYIMKTRDPEVTSEAIEEAKRNPESLKTDLERAYQEARQRLSEVPPLPDFGPKTQFRDIEDELPNISGITDFIAVFDEWPYDEQLAFSRAMKQVVEQFQNEEMPDLSGIEGKTRLV